jgi:hypothetical protein
MSLTTEKEYSMDPSSRVNHRSTVGDGPDDANCRGVLQGKTLIGGIVYVATGGTPVAKGTIVR